MQAIPGRPAVERSILAACDATPPRISVLVGGCGSGRTSLLLRLAGRLDDGRSQYIDAERAASTPEAFWAAVEAASPYVVRGAIEAPRAVRPTRAAFDSLLAFFGQARTPEGEASTFLIDELFELRTFESFPGLRGALGELVAALTRSANRFVLATRYTNRARRLLGDAAGRVELMHVPPLSPAETASALVRLGLDRSVSDPAEVTRLIHVLADGRPAYVQALGGALTSSAGASRDDPVHALASQLAAGAALHQACRRCYELRLGRARGYGALKAILQLLADEERLTLTEIALRLGRTPGATKDYLLWLEDVDLIRSERKRYCFRDPMLRLWVRLHGRPTPPDDADLMREAQEYAVSRLPLAEPALGDDPPEPPRRAAVPQRDWSIVEID